MIHQDTDCRGQDNAISQVELVGRGPGIVLDSPAHCLPTELAGNIRRVDTGGREEKFGIALVDCNNSQPGPDGVQMVGYADPHHIQTLDTHTSGIGYQRKDGL